MSETQQTVSPSAQLVLIVEDDEHTREMCAEWLIFSGFRVAEAKDGPEAIEKARTLKPDVITTNIGLKGGIDGCQLTRESEILYPHEQDSSDRRDRVGDGRACRTRPKSRL